VETCGINYIIVQTAAPYITDYKPTNTIAAAKYMVTDSFR